VVDPIWDRSHTFAWMDTGQEVEHGPYLKAVGTHVCALK
jgi:hypothetical protein